MAKAATTAAASDKKKKRKKATVGAASPAKKGKKAAAPKKKRPQGLNALAKLADHPLLADLLAAGAIAAVAVIADHQVGGKKSTSSKLIKTAGQAAAAAIGKKLMGDFGAIKTAATAAAKKA